MNPRTGFIVSEEAWNLLKEHSDFIVTCLMEQTRKLKHLGILIEESDTVRLFYDLSPFEQSKIDKIFKNKCIISNLNTLYQEWGPHLNKSNIEKIKYFINNFFNPIESCEKWKQFWSMQTQTIKKSNSKFNHPEIFYPYIDKVYNLIMGAFFYKAISIYAANHKEEETSKIKKFSLRHEIFTKVTNNDSEAVIKHFNQKFESEIKSQYSTVLVALIDIDEPEIKRRFNLAEQVIQSTLLYKILPNSQSIFSNLSLEIHKKINGLGLMFNSVAEESMAYALTHPAKRSSGGHPPHREFIGRSPRHKKPEQVAELPMDKILNGDAQRSHSPDSDPETKSLIPPSLVSNSFSIPFTVGGSQSTLSVSFQINLSPENSTQPQQDHVPRKKTPRRKCASNSSEREEYPVSAPIVQPATLFCQPKGSLNNTVLQPPSSAIPTTTLGKTSP